MDSIDLVDIECILCHSHMIRVDTDPYLHYHHTTIPVYKSSRLFDQARTYYLWLYNQLDMNVVNLVYRRPRHLDN